MVNVVAQISTSYSNRRDEVAMLSSRCLGRYLRPNVIIAHHQCRSFTLSPQTLEKPLPPRRTIPESEITEAFLKGTGPGGQKINKTSSAVQLKHLPTGIVVKCQETRSREQNRKMARRLLSDKLEEMEKGDESRTAIKAERARVKKASAEKKRRRKYRKLGEEQAGGEDGDVNRKASPEDEPAKAEESPGTRDSRDGVP